MVFMFNLTLSALFVFLVFGRAHESIQEQTKQLDISYESLKVFQTTLLYGKDETTN